MNSDPQTENATTLYTELERNTMHIQRQFGYSEDLIIKELTSAEGWRLALLFMDGLVDNQIVNQSIIEPILSKDRRTADPDLYNECANPLIFLKEAVLTAGDVCLLDDESNLYTSLLSGGAILLTDGFAEGLQIGAAGWEGRNVSEPTSQGVVRGPMEAFTENIRNNTAMIRRRIKDPWLWHHNFQIGTVTKTSVAVMYIKHIADDAVVKEVFSRLDKIKIDGVLESGYIEEFIQDKTYTPFPTVYNTERPDTIAAGLLEGRIAILVDGTPFVLLIPALFVQFFQSAEDYYQRFDISSLLRVIRFLSFFIALLAPSLYIAVTTFHQEMLPTNLLINLSAQREGVPFPAFIEAMLMEVTFEILREAGVRIPKTVGQAVSIVGTLVIGQAAVEAGIVSAAMVIIVAITAISSFVLPSVSLTIAVRMIRFVLMGLAASFGLFGILIGLIALVLHLTTLRSFGVPYMSSFAPFSLHEQKDTLFRVPWRHMIRRPLSISGRDTVRQDSDDELNN